MAKEIFISYSRKDFDKVKALKDELDRELDINCWMDLDGIESGDQFETKIIDAINSHRFFLFMLSPNSMASEFALDELAFAKEKGKRVILIYITPCQMTDTFAFKYKKYDIIDWNDSLQHDKLIRNLRKWLMHKPKIHQESTEHVVTEISPQTYSQNLYYATFPQELIAFLCGRGNTKEQDINIPPIYEHANKYDVVEIAENAFKGDESITSVTIPSSVEKIGVSAFSECPLLKTIKIMEGVKRIEDGAFYGCASLRNVVIPDSVTFVAPSAFRNCRRLESIEISANPPQGMDWKELSKHYKIIQRPEGKNKGINLHFGRRIRHFSYLQVTWFLVTFILLCLCFVCIWLGIWKDGNITTANPWGIKPWRSPHFIVPFFKILLPIFIVDLVLVWLASFRKLRWVYGLISTIPFVTWDIWTHEITFEYMRWPTWVPSGATIAYILFIGMVCVSLYYIRRKDISAF